MLTLSVVSVDICTKSITSIDVNRLEYNSSSTRSVNNVIDGGNECMSALTINNRRNHVHTVRLIDDAIPTSSICVMLLVEKLIKPQYIIQFTHSEIQLTRLNTKNNCFYFTIARSRQQLLLCMYVMNFKNINSNQTLMEYVLARFERTLGINKKNWPVESRRLRSNSGKNEVQIAVDERLTYEPSVNNNNNNNNNTKKKMKTQHKTGTNSCEIDQVLAFASA
jgi:hypothetical protein